MIFNQDKSIVYEAASKITLLALDVDGVLTDGRIYFSKTGEEIKTFHTLDGQGIKMLHACAIGVALITGRSSTILEKRAADLGIETVIQGREDKLTALSEILEAQSLSIKQVAYVGDDLPDLSAMRNVGVSFSVPNGHPEIRAASHAVTTAEGGLGAVREITDFILKTKKKYASFYHRS